MKLNSILAILLAGFATLTSAKEEAKVAEAPQAVAQGNLSTAAVSAVAVATAAVVAAAGGTGGSTSTSTATTATTTK